jgi:hypothetical protein
LFARRIGLRCDETPAPSEWNTAVAHQYAARLSLIAFATATIQGAMRQAGFEPALKFALAAAAAFFVLGWLCGELARRIVEESVTVANRTQTSAPSPAPPIPNTTGR